MIYVFTGTAVRITDAGVGVCLPHHKLLHRLMFTMWVVFRLFLVYSPVRS